MLLFKEEITTNESLTKKLNHYYSNSKCFPDMCSFCAKMYFFHFPSILEEEDKIWFKGAMVLTEMVI